MTRLRTLAIVLTLTGSSVAAVLWDASRRRADRESEPSHAALAETIRVTDLALSTSARWLRHPSQAESGAATSDVPSGLDVDPAGALIGPPREILNAGSPR